MIPKIIWQTHENKYEDLEPFQKNIINTWKNLNPGWKYNYVDAEQRSKDVKKYDENLYQYYLALGKIHQADIWRFVTIYNYGGFYADMDSICIKTIEDSMDKKYKQEEMICSLIGFQHPGINNSNFGAVKNSKIIKSVIDSLIVQYRDIGLSQIPYLDFGFPENNTFSIITQENKDLIFFSNDYFSHTLEYKTYFNNNVDVAFNKNIVNYHQLCIDNNWTIY